MPLSTGTGYHNRHDYKIRAHAKFSHPEEYAIKPTSKGYFINSFLESARTIIHRIKHTGLPFEYPDSWISNPTDAESDELLDSINHFINCYPTIMFTQNHISKRRGALKQRPVYAVDELFLTIESMLTFPLNVQARSHQCCIMYGLETIRGANHYLDQVAQLYSS